jgi:hypothetical protein
MGTHAHGGKSLKSMKQEPAKQYRGALRMPVVLARSPPVVELPLHRACHIIGLLFMLAQGSSPVQRFHLLVEYKLRAHTFISPAKSCEVTFKDDPYRGPCRG